MVATVGISLAEKANAENPLAPYIKLAGASRDAIAAVKDYEATFTKQELVGRVMFASKMIIKLRKNPFSVYLRFIDKNAGREVIYVEGRNNGKLLAHETGIKALVGTVALNPTDPQAMAEGRHPITEIGMQKMVEGVIRQWEAEAKLGPEETKPLFYGNAKLAEIDCKVLETTHPHQLPQFRFYRTRLFIDKKTNFPIRLQQWAFAMNGGEPILVEDYMYTNIRTNVGLTDMDFDTRNRKYRF
jgi:hypothetical protein